MVVKGGVIRGGDGGSGEANIIQYIHTYINTQQSQCTMLG